MRKIIFTFFVILSVSAGAFCARQFIEGTDYQIDFRENMDDMAAVLHINFTNIVPTSDEAEKLIKEQLRTYAKIMEKEAEAKKKTEAKNAPVKNKAADRMKKDAAQNKAKDVSVDTQTYKNIIGSVWYNTIPQQSTGTSAQVPMSQQPAVVTNTVQAPLVPVVPLSSDISTSTDVIKVKFKDNVSAYVYLGKTKRIVPFPDYINFLKKERDAKKAKEKADAAAAAQAASQQNSPPSEQLPADQSATETDTKQ